MSSERVITTQPMKSQKPMSDYAYLEDPVRPIATQPRKGLAFCPPGLEYLMTIDELLVKQRVEIIEAVCGCETPNRYDIVNAMGQRIFFAKEESQCLSRNFWCIFRPFIMTILDNHQQEVIRLIRPLRCTTFLCLCCLQEIEVQAPPGKTVGFVVEDWTGCESRLLIMNERKEVLFYITVPSLCHRSVCCLCRRPHFQIMSLNRQTQVGSIIKEWSGLMKEAFTDADNFGVSFPLDLDINIKATLLGAVFLIDFMFFERLGCTLPTFGVRAAGATIAHVLD